MLFQENPLADFKKRSGMSWAEMVAASGVHLSSLQRVIKAKRPDDLQHVRVITLMRIYKNLGVDFFKYLTK